jgi:hypothetical protein
MTRRIAGPRISPPDDLSVPAAVAVPPGTPRWISAELIAETIRTWQPYYQEPLTPEDAIAMIRNIGRLVDVLARGTEDETLRSTRSGQ